MPLEAPVITTVAPRRLSMITRLLSPTLSRRIASFVGGITHSSVASKTLDSALSRYLSARDPRRDDGARRYQGRMSDPAALPLAIDTGGGKNDPKCANALRNESLVVSGSVRPEGCEPYAARLLASIPSIHQGFALSLHS